MLRPLLSHTYSYFNVYFTSVTQPLFFIFFLNRFLTQNIDMVDISFIPNTIKILKTFWARARFLNVSQEIKNSTFLKALTPVDGKRDTVSRKRRALRFFVNQQQCVFIWDFSWIIDKKLRLWMTAIFWMLFIFCEFQSALMMCETKNEGKFPKYKSKLRGHSQT